MAKSTAGKKGLNGEKLFVVYSTLTASQAYTTWEKGEGDIQHQTGQVLIKGGANVADKHMETPKGVATIITEKELEQARRDQVFGRHEANGFLKVEPISRDIQPHAEDIEDAVSDLEARDEAAPLTPDDYLAKNETPPIVNKASK